MAFFVLALVMTGGLWLLPKRVRAIANDEAFAQSLIIAHSSGFLASMLVALLVFAAAPIAPLPAARAAHIIISTGLGMALVMFGFAQSRHER